MKIITIEEHVNDKTLTAATKEMAQKEAPYYADAMRPDLAYAPSVSQLEDIGDGRIADMDANGISMQIISYSNPTQWLPKASAVSMTRDANDKLAAAIQKHPDRFGAFAALPWTDPEAAALELERTVTQFGFKGVLLTGRPGDTFLDDPRYAPVLAAAEKLEVPIYTHPGVPKRAVQEAYYAGLDPIVSARLSLFGWGWHAEPGVQLLRMILSGVFQKYPRLQVIAGHWGEMVPFFLARLDQSLAKEITHLPKTITEYFLSNVYVTPSGMFTLPHFKFILDVVGADRIIYSVDYPYIGNSGAREFLENAPISQSDKEKIAHGNAERLFRL